MSNRRTEIDPFCLFIRKEIEKICNEYWEAYFWERGRTKVNGQVFTWGAGCQIKETEYGAQLQWYYIEHLGRGVAPYYCPLIEDNAPTNACYHKLMMNLQPAERTTVMAVKSLAAPLEKLEARIEEYDQIGQAIMESAQALGWLPQRQ